MKMAKRYLAYGLKKNLWRTVVLSLISALVCIMTISGEATGGEIKYRRAGIYILAVVISVFSAIIPMLELEGFKNRRNLDTLYFFPIERKKMAVVHFVSGFVQVVAIYTVAFATSFIYLLARTNYFALGYMVPYYLLSLLIGLVMYSFFCFIFIQGNTVADGVIFCVIWIFVPYIIMSVGLETFVKAFWGPADNVWHSAEIREWNQMSNLTPWGMVFTPINNLTVIFQEFIEVNRHNPTHLFSDTYAYRYMQEMYMFFVWGAVGIASAIGFIFGFARKGAHMAGEPSYSWFGYKTLIPICGYSLILLLASKDSFDFLFIMCWVLMFIGYVIYRRSFKIKKSDIIVMVCGVVPAIVGIVLHGLMPVFDYGM